jgi:hypothetical protein
MGLMKNVTKCHIPDTQPLMLERFMTDHSAYRWHPYYFTSKNFFGLIRCIGVAENKDAKLK